MNSRINQNIREAAGRAPAVNPQPTPLQVQRAQEYAAVVGCTLSEALRTLAATEQPIPSGAAGAGTQNPPRGKLDMNAVIRALVQARKMIGG